MQEVNKGIISLLLPGQHIIYERTTFQHNLLWKALPFEVDTQMSWGKVFSEFDVII